MVVHFLGKEKVVGSIPALGSITECSSAWPERLLWEQNVGGSNPSTPTIFGPVAQWQSRGLINPWSQVQSLPGPPKRFQWADSSTVERFNGIEEMAVQFRPCPPFQNGCVFNGCEVRVSFRKSTAAEA